ncbi:MAG: SAM-dependent methyltransferase [Pseudobdellovibrio sp.]
MIRLSDRLNFVFSNLLPDQDVWDFCCDHGYLGSAAYESWRFKNVYFVDPVDSIIQKLQRNFQKSVFKTESKSLAHFRSQPGESLSEPVQGTACILGVGAFVIYEILSALAEKRCLQAQRLILGPHRDGEKLLTMIQENSLFNCYTLTSQKEVVENDRIRDFFIFDLVK